MKSHHRVAPSSSPTYTNETLFATPALYRNGLLLYIYRDIIRAFSLAWAGTQINFHKDADTSRFRGSDHNETAVLCLSCLNTITIIWSEP